MGMRLAPFMAPVNQHVFGGLHKVQGKSHFKADRAIIEVFFLSPREGANGINMG